MNSELLTYHQTIIDTYLYFIKENLSLVRSIYSEESKKPLEGYNPRQKWKLYTSRAKHLQIMTIIGLTAEHLVKIILLKRGFVLNTGEFEAKFQDDFMLELEKVNRNEITQSELDTLYSKATEKVNFSFKKNLKSFEECISIFEASNPSNYYDALGEVNLNPNPNARIKQEYLGYPTIKPQETLRVIQKMRNSYLHKAEAQGEYNAVVWYLFDFLVWLCKKEYLDFFKDEEYIGSDEFQKLFKR